MEFNYRCSVCHTVYDIPPELTVCPDCSRHQLKDQPLTGVLEVELHGTINMPFAAVDMLPVEPVYFPPVPVGNTLPVGA